MAHIAKVIICHVNARPPVVGVTSYEAQSCFYSSGKSSPSHTFVTLVCSPSFFLFLSLFHQEGQNTIIFCSYHPRHSRICLLSTSAELLYNHQVKMSHFALSSVSDRFRQSPCIWSFFRRGWSRTGAKFPSGTPAVVVAGFPSGTL